MADAKVASPLNVYVATLRSLETPDRHSVILRFNGPGVLVMPPAHLGGRYRAEHVWAGTHIRKNPALAMAIGTAPFKLKGWQRSSYLVFEANRGYFRKGGTRRDVTTVRVEPRLDLRPPGASGS